MSTDIRVLAGIEEMQAANVIAMHAFGHPQRHEPSSLFEHMRESSRPEWYLGAFDSGEMAAMMGIIPNEMYLNGAALPFGAVSPVATSPLHRRKGHAGLLMQRSLRVMRERGQPVSGLYTPHPAFYRRYGWEIASELRRFTFQPKDFRPLVQPAQLGSFRWLTRQDREPLERVYGEYAARGNGAFRRSEGWWRFAVLESPFRKLDDIVLWQDDDGEPKGYALYQQTQTAGSDEASRIVVIELITASADAYLNLMTYFGRHDIHREIVIYGSPDDPLPLLFADTERLQMTQEYGVLLRVVDFEAAMALRPAARPEDSCEVVLRIEDATAPWNDGVWRAGIAEGRSWAERTGAAPELTLPARTLGAMFNGYMSASRAAAAGLLQAAGNEDALRRADRVFAVTRAPFFPDSF